MPALGALDLTGPEAIGFAQRISANDVAALADGDWHWNCVLSPQGRVLSLFRLWRRSAEQLTLILPAASRSATGALLTRYLLRAKVRVADEGTAVIAGKTAVLDADPRRMTSTDGRWLALSPPGEHQCGEAPELTRAWQIRDVAQGVPWLAPGAAESFTPQALSLERLNAFSVRKGCYPGQEIVARMHFLGQNKRSLRRFAVADPITVGAPLFVPALASRVVGHVVSTVSIDGGMELLAVVQGAAADQPIFADEACASALQTLEFDAPPLPVQLVGLAKG